VSAVAERKVASEAEWERLRAQAIAWEARYPEEQTADWDFFLGDSKRPLSRDFVAVLHARARKFANGLQPRIKRERQGHDHLYIVSDGEAVKIGRASHFGRRLQSLQCSTHRDLCVLVVLHGRGCLETRLHRAFEADWIRGEWFKKSVRIDRFVRRCKRWCWLVSQGEPLSAENSNG